MCKAFDTISGVFALTAAALLLALGLTACGGTVDGTSASSEQITVTMPSEGRLSFACQAPTDASTVEMIVVPEEMGLELDAVVSSGKFTVTVLGEGESVLYASESFTGDDARLVPEANGACAVRVEAREAVGTVDVRLYSLADGADADDDEDDFLSDILDEVSGEGAANAAGMASFSVPAEVFTAGKVFSSPRYEADGAVAHAVYESDGAVLTVKQSLTEEGQQLAGDDRNAPDTWEVSVPSGFAQCHGSRESGTLWASWSSGGYNYSISISGVDGEDLRMSDPEVSVIIAGVR